MKKFFAVLTVVLFALTSIFAAGSKEASAATNVIKVGATPDPHAILLNLVVDNLAAEGYKLEVIEFTDYVTPNDALESGEIDANYFQHIPYLESFNTEHGYHLVNAGGIHVEPLALYSKKVSALADLKDGATIAIPNDPTNEGRALLLLQSAGLIKLSDASGLEATPADITSNPKGLKFREIEAATLPESLRMSTVRSSTVTTQFLQASSQPAMVSSLKVLTARTLTSSQSRQVTRTMQVSRLS